MKDTFKLNNKYYEINSIDFYKYYNLYDINTLLSYNIVSEI